MNQEKFTRLVDGIHQSRLNILRLKGHDYAGEDRLSSFGRLQEVCAALNIQPNRSPADCALFLVILKLDRWTNLRNQGAAPWNESIQDTVVDLHNYLDLALACDLDIGSALDYWPCVICGLPAEDGNVCENCKASQQKSQ